jgi:ABC-type multidrug transport system ATPase subunit
VPLIIDEGETVGILGCNGSGKSTLLKCICGLLHPTSGEVGVPEGWPGSWSWAPASNGI